MRIAVVAFVFLAIWVVACAATLPDVMDFEHYVSGDPGANLTLDRLLSESYTPIKDCSYLYGTLSLCLTEVWFAVAGRSPWSLYALMLLGGTIVASGYATIAKALEFNAWQVLFALAALQTNFYPGRNCIPIYVFESSLLVWALAFQSLGRKQGALALCTFAALTKPSMAYVYGLIILLLWVRENIASGTWRRLARGLAPAATVGVIGSCVAMSLYGAGPFVTNLLPTAARQVYQVEEYGFFKAGYAFWAGPPGASTYYYLGSPAGFWVAGSIALVAGALTRIRAVLSGVGTRADEVAVTAAALHITFVSLAFAHFFSYSYYYFVLVFGLASLYPRGPSRAARLGRLIGALLLALAVVSNYGALRGIPRAWAASRYAPEVRGFARAGPLAEWRRVTSLGETRRVYVLYYLGGAREIDGRVNGPSSWCFYHWQCPPTELARIRAELKTADVMVIPKYLNYYRSPRHPVNGASLADLVAEFDKREEGEAFIVCTRSITPP